MFDYTISKDVKKEDYDIFLSQIERIRKYLPTEAEEKRIEDVDGSIIHIFRNTKIDITIYFDIEVGAVYIKSNIPLTDNIIVNLFHN